MQWGWVRCLTTDLTRTRTEARQRLLSLKDFRLLHMLTDSTCPIQVTHTQLTDSHHTPSLRISSSSLSSQFFLLDRSIYCFSEVNVFTQRVLKTLLVRPAIKTSLNIGNNLIMFSSIEEKCIFTHDRLFFFRQEEIFEM